VALADCYSVLGEYAGFPAKECRSKSRAAALAALKLDDTLGEARAVLASIKQEEWDWLGAEAEFGRAIEVAPNYATAHHWYCILLRDLGRFDEARLQIQRAQELDPLSPIISVNVGLLAYFQRDYDRAIAVCRAVLEANPKFSPARLLLGTAYLMKQMYPQALTEFQTIRASVGNVPYGLSELGCAYAMSHRADEARRVLDELMGFLKQGYDVQEQLALVYNCLGDHEQTLDWLERALEAQVDLLSRLKCDPRWQNLRTEPRFVALLKKMGLEK
jgi:adenylate cyclase